LALPASTLPLPTKIPLNNQNTSERQNIVEWNVALLLILYYAGMFSLWKNFTQFFSIKQP